MREYLDGRIVAQTGDITIMNVDAIVNAANASLLGGGGVDGAIHAAGGSAIIEACRDIRRHRYPEGLPVGKAVVTTAGDLPSQYVIHTVGPVWRGGSSNEASMLQEAYTNSMTLATETGISSIAFPAISTGVYGYPKERAARIMLEVVNRYLTEHALPRTVYLVFFSNRDLDLFVDSNQGQSQG